MLLLRKGLIWFWWWQGEADSGKRCSFQENHYMSENSKKGNWVYSLIYKPIPTQTVTVEEKMIKILHTDMQLNTKSGNIKG